MFPDAVTAVDEKSPLDIFFARWTVTLESVPDGSPPVLGKPVMLHPGLLPDFGVDRREGHCAPSFHGRYDEFCCEAHGVTSPKLYPYNCHAMIVHPFVF